MTKIILNLKEGLLEVEGEESFVKSVYEDFKNLHTNYKQGDSMPNVKKANTQEHNSSPTMGASKKKKSPKKNNISLVKELDLSAKKNNEDLKTFYAAKGTLSNNMEKNAVFVYFLKRITKEPNVTVDHVYTCYKYVNEKVPGALAQSLLDTASRKGWIDTANMNSIDVSISGENFIEHDLPKVDKK